MTDVVQSSYGIEGEESNKAEEGMQGELTIRREMVCQV